MDANAKTCQACGTVAKPGDLFCLNCGAKLPADSPAVAAPSASMGSNSAGGGVAQPAQPSAGSVSAAPAGSVQTGSTASGYAAPSMGTPPPSSPLAGSPASQPVPAPSTPLGGQSTPPPPDGVAQTAQGGVQPPQASASAVGADTPPQPTSSAGSTGAPSQPTSYGATPSSSYGAAGASTTSSPAYGTPSSAAAQPKPPVPPYGQPPSQGSAPYGQQAPSGTSAPYGQQPQGGAAPAYGQQQTQPGAAGYGQQPQQGQPGAAPYGQTGQAPANYPGQQGQQPGQYGGYGVPPAQTKKKKSAAPIIIVAVVLAVAVIGVVAFFLLRGSGAKAEYQELLTNITSSSTPAQVAGWDSQLELFNTENPDVADSDLLSLVSACKDYENAADDEYRYTDMIYELERLSSSSVPEVASCASTLLSGVESDYEDYQYWVEEEAAAAAAEAAAAAGGEEGGAASAGAYDGSSTPMPVVGNGLGVIEQRDGDTIFSFHAENVSDKAISYFEVVVFCYDSAGNPIVGDNGYVWEWKMDDSMTIEPGGQHVPERDGYWAISNHSDVAYVVPVVVYATFTDGTSWGNKLSTADRAAFAESLQPMADSIMAAAL